MKKGKINSGVIFIAGFLFVLASFIVACSKIDDSTPSGNGSSGTESQRVIKGTIKNQNLPDLPNIIVSSLAVDGSLCGHNTGRPVTVTLTATTCSSWITSGPGVLYYNWRSTSCTAPISFSWPSSTCAPVFCLTKNQYWYLTVSSQANGAGSSSSCYSVYVPN